MKNKFSLFTALVLLGCSGGWAQAQTVSAVGRILPGSGVIDLAAPAGDTVEAVLVKEGAWVEAGTPLARLGSAAAAQHRVRQAEAEVASARQRQQGDLALARQLLAVAEEEAQIAEARLKRIRDAGDSEFISPDTIEARSLAAAAARSKLAQARQDLAKTEREGRKAVDLAEGEVRTAGAALAASQVQAPVKSRVLKILARPGQSTGRQDLFKLGDTSTIHVVAEVYETDVLKVKTGQRATITSPAFPKAMTGVVENVGGMVFRNTLQSMDPNAQVFARVVEVVIKMDAVDPLDRLIFLQVDVKISL